MVNEVDYPGSNPGPIIFHLSLVLNIIAYDKNVSKENKIFALEGKKQSKSYEWKRPLFQGDTLYDGWHQLLRQSTAYNDLKIG